MMTGNVVKKGLQSHFLNKEEMIRLARMYASGNKDEVYSQIHTILDNKNTELFKIRFSNTKVYHFGMSSFMNKDFDFIPSLKLTNKEFTKAESPLKKNLTEKHFLFSNCKNESFKPTKELSKFTNFKSPTSGGLTYNEESKEDVSQPNIQYSSLTFIDKNIISKDEELRLYKKKDNLPFVKNVYIRNNILYDHSSLISYISNMQNEIMKNLRTLATTNSYPVYVQQKDNKKLTLLLVDGDDPDQIELQQLFDKDFIDFISKETMDTFKEIKEILDDRSELVSFFTILYKGLQAIEESYEEGSDGKIRKILKIKDFDFTVQNTDTPDINS